jgi:putative transposase
LVCEIPDVQIVNNNPDIGIDIGLKELAVLSNGVKISNPKFLINSEKRLKLLHRRHSKKKKGSKNRFKSKFRLAKQYLKVSNQRSDYLHKVTHELTGKYKIFKVEKLNIQNMVKNHYLAKSINDASWNQLIQYLSYKASSAGGQVIEVNPRNTTKKCSRCGNIQEMPLNKRTYKCSNCGLVIDRDLNASINIKNTVGTTGINACGKDVRLFNEKQTSMNQELNGRTQNQ